MKSLTIDQIEEIAEQLDCGFKCYWNRENGELIFVPGEMRHIDIDFDAWSEEFTKIDKNFSDYEVINPLESHESFEIMVDFVDTVTDNELKDRLINSLNRRKPFREFHYMISNAGANRQKWFDYKKARMKQWVMDCIDEININIKNITQ